MKKLEIHSCDPTLIRALEAWWEEFSPCLSPEDQPPVLVDLDSAPMPVGIKVLTFSRSLPCDLPRPFSFEDLQQLILQRPVSSHKRLAFMEDKAYLDGKILTLSPLEYRILKILFLAREPVSAQKLSLALWGEERTSNQINVYIRYLRKKTDLPGRERLIHTLRKEGFYIKNDN